MQTTVESSTELAQTIIGMERAALERWGRGDPSRFLEISADDVVYFDPYQSRRLNGLAELRALYESIRGQVQIARFDVYRRDAEGWRIIQTHWSFTQPPGTQV